MHPFFMLLLAILTPFLLMMVLLLPSYLAVLGASYIIYYPAAGLHPLAGKYFDVFEIVDVYSKLVSYWLQHMDGVSLLHYTLPLLGLPLVALVLTFVLVRWLVRKLHDVFHIGVGNH